MVQIPETGPSVVLQIPGTAEARPDGIQMNVVFERAQLGVFLDNQTLVAPLEQLAMNLAKAVITIGKGGLQPLHSVTLVPPGVRITR
jgi:hypothetical protein